MISLIVVVSLFTLSIGSICRGLMISNGNKRGKRIERDVRAGIEGLPLQLMVLVLIAGVGTAIMLGWMSGLSAPSSIGSVHADVDQLVLQDNDQDGVYRAQGVQITITVLDQNGDSIEGATVVLSGCQISDGSGGSPHGITDSAGQVRFNQLSLTSFGGGVSFVQVTAAKGGMGTDSSTSVPVVCG